MTDGFNSCRNVVCNFTEGNIHISSMSSFQRQYQNKLISNAMLLQELCTRSPRYAYRKELWIQPEALAKNPMFSTV
jgi:hypothetical protein